MLSLDGWEYIRNQETLGISGRHLETIGGPWRHWKAEQRLLVTWLNCWINPHPKLWDWLALHASCILSMNSASWSLLCYVNFTSSRLMSFFLSVSPCGFVRTQYPWRSGLVLSTNKNDHTITDFVKFLLSFYLMITYSEWALSVRIMYVCHWSSADFVLCSFRSRPTKLSHCWGALTTSHCISF